VAALRDRLQRDALLRVGPLIDDRLPCAVAKVDRGRPGAAQTPAQAVEGNVAVTAFFHLHEHVRVTVTARGRAIELARAAPVATAVRKLDALHGPFYKSHGKISFRWLAGAGESNRFEPRQGFFCGRASQHIPRAWRANCARAFRERSSFFSSLKIPE